MNFYHEMEFKNDLDRLAYKYGTDKCPQILHFYTEFYYKLLKDRRESIKKVLELGVGCTENMHCPHYVDGASLYMWRDFFPNAQIYGIDTIPELVFKKDRIETFLCNACLKKDLVNLINKIGSDIDLFIDDGSHIPRHQVFTCKTLMPMLKKDVIYIIEDVRNQDIVDHLGDYDCHIVRKRKLADKYDRLVVVKNKK